MKSGREKRTGGGTGKGRVNPNDREDGVRLGPLGGFIDYNLRLAQSVSFRTFARSVGKRGLKVGHFSALMLVHHNPGISQIALGRAIARDKSTVTPLIRTWKGAV